MARVHGEPVGRLMPLYAEMVSRIQVHYLSLVGQAQAGNEAGLLVEAERLIKQTAALYDLLSMKMERV